MIDLLCMNFFCISSNQSSYGFNDGFSDQVMASLITKVFYQELTCSSFTYDLASDSLNLAFS